jgi:uncharacterized repeat protein (TIGR03806 family)
MARLAAQVVIICAGVALAACGGAPCTPGGGGGYFNGPYPKLSDYCLVDLVDGNIQPKPGVLPYDLNTPLFSDDAVKVRTVWMPPGTSAKYDPDLTMDFPDGTLISKSFGMRDDLRKANPVIHWVETRILMKVNGTWQGYAYAWDSEQREATLDPAGGVQPITFIDEDGGTVTANYLIPGQNQCKQCHANADVMAPIGPKARQLNRVYAYPDGGENQLVRWGEVGFLSGAPDPADAPKLPVWNDPTTGTVEQRARAYLEGNCAHCHNADGFARTTGLYLWASESNPSTYGVCKPPVAAGPGSGGFKYDVVPGDPDHSILVHRIESTQPGILMPPLGRSVVDEAGVALVSDWVSGISGSCP